MNTLLLEPTDTLFFRDGRPMGGASSGHGAAWPLPTVINHAFHAALHRAGLEGVHEHRRARSGRYQETRDRKFGSLTTTGPFPVCPDNQWFFPRPADAGDTGRPVLFPSEAPGSSSLQAPCHYPVLSTHPPSKDTAAPWWSAAAWQRYLDPSNPSALSNPSDTLHDSAFADTEFTYGIGMDPETGVQDGERFYSASYLRLHPGWRLGVIAEALDKADGGSFRNRDLIAELLPNSGARTPVIVGGQQRLCSVLRENLAQIPLPRAAALTGTRVKWVLLTPTIFPGIGDHPGGWLPSWVDLNGNVQLMDGPGRNYARRHQVPEGRPIQAKLVAAVIPKPIPVTGYALPHEAAERPEGGAKPTHLAVAAGAVYYFEADSPEDATRLAAALNWHGAVTGNDATDFAAIKNRRSTLLGEKGFGLGVCGAWEFHPGTLAS